MPPKPPEIYRWALRHGWIDKGGKGSHRKLERFGRVVVIPYHRKELARGTWERLKRDMGYPGNEGKSK